MKLIRRKKSTPPAQKAVNVVRLAAKGLVLQRIARKGVRRAAWGYRWTRRIPYLLGGAAAAAALSKLLGRKKEAPLPAQAPPPPEPPRKPEAPTSPEVAATTDDGAPSTEPELDVEAPNEATPPAPAEAEKDS
jgi:hypothetical protein